MANINHYYSINSCQRGQWTGPDSFIFLTNKSGVNQIWQKALSPDAQEVQRTFLTERVWSVSVAPNGKDIFFTMDTGGNEQEQIYMLADGAKEPVNLTANDKARHQFGGVKPDGQTIVYACNARNPKNFDICQMDTKTGKAVIVLENTDSYNTPAALSPNGKYLLYNKLKAQSDNCLWMVDLDSGKAENVDPNASFAQYTNPVWKHDSTGFYLLTDAGSQYKYLAYYDMATKKLSKLYEENWDVENLALSHDDKYLGMQINRDGYSVLEIYNTKTGQMENTPAGPKGVMGYYGMSWAPDSHKVLFSVTSGKRPADIWMLDMDKDQVVRMTFTATEGIDKDEMVEPVLCHFKSFDGLSVPYWFYKAPNAPQGPVPVVLDIHGGPEGQERPTFTPLTQYLLSQGLSIVAPNVRGSTGYGKDYHHLDDVEKRLDSVADAAALAKHLVADGIALQDKIAVMGVSYGGYMTLACITHYPELWAAAVDTVGMSNLETFLENTADYRRAHRESEYGSLEHHREVLRKVSPMHKVDKITAPLMVVHGANDPRVPVGEAEQIVASLRGRGVPVEYLRYEDEGHGLAKRKNQLDCYPKVAEFLKKYLAQ